MNKKGKKEKGENLFMNKKGKYVVLAVVLAVICAMTAGGLLLLNRDKPVVAEKEEENPVKGLEVDWDISWYDDKEDEFVITTKEQLIGFANLSITENFKGKTIKLGADIALNVGSAEDWLKKVPDIQWTPIKRFAGTFDGQGHTISGLYINSSDEVVGMFADTDSNCIIRDFRLRNSCYDVATDESVGGISSHGGGLFEKIYCDVIIKNDGSLVGGIIGSAKGDVTLKECWFAGSITQTGRFGGGMIAAAGGSVLISNCLNSGTITSEHTKAGAATIGGIIGIQQGLTNVSDTLNVGSVTSIVDKPEVGSIVGVIANGSANFTNVWATEESAEATIASVTSGKSEGICLTREQEMLKGDGSYRLMLLDFENYWSVVEGNTAVLKYFATESPSLDGIKAVDVSWYDREKTSYRLDTPEAFYGFMVLGQNNTFADKEITLSVDVEGFDETFGAWLPIPKFEGAFDGGNHTISGLHAKANTAVAMFGTTTEKTMVMNFKLTDSSFVNTRTTEAGGVGSIAANGGGTFKNIYSNATTEGTYYAGGMMGYNDLPTVFENCQFDGKVTGHQKYHGGFIGLNNNDLVIAHCLNSGTVSATFTGVTHIGGFVGRAHGKLTIQDCLNVGEISIPNGFTGGIIGSTNKEAELNIANAYVLEGSAKRPIFENQTQEGKTEINVLLEMKEELLTGYNGYRLTLLDFDKYWVAIEKGTPALKTFAEQSLNLEGVAAVDVSWYKEDETSYEIKSNEAFYGFMTLAQNNTFANKTIILKSDIDFDGEFGDWKPIPKFEGTFDGENHTIKGLNVKMDGAVAMFSKTTANTEIANFTLSDSSFINTRTAESGGTGSIIAEGGGTLKNIHSMATVEGGYYVGGLIGLQNVETSIVNCWYQGDTKVNIKYGGGFIGINFAKLEISHSLNSGTVTGTPEGVVHVGGFVGRAHSTLHINDCLNVGVITTPNNFRGAILGSTNTEAVLNIDYTYALKGSAARPIWENNAKESNIGLCMEMDAEYLNGYKGYQMTLLDFEKYWDVVDGGTPVLKSFTTVHPSLDGCSRMDISWYNESDTVYNINSTEAFYGFMTLAQKNTFAGKTIHLKTNVDVDDLFGAWLSIPKFEGIFDGNNNTISGLKVENSTAAAMFHKTTKDTEIKNFTLVDSSFVNQRTSEGGGAGSIIAEGGGKLSNIYVKQTVVEGYYYVGGLIGLQSAETSISNCWFDGNVVINAKFGGGFVGFNNAEIKIEHSLNSGAITGTPGGVVHIGGFVGRAHGNLTLNDCLNTGAVTTPNGFTGAILGSTNDKALLCIDHTWALQGSGAKVIWENQVTAANNHITLCEEIRMNDLESYNGYKNTTLDFTNYWEVVVGVNETPILKSFTNVHPDLTGYTRMDISWYDADETSYELKTESAFYGFMILAQKNTFSGKTIDLTTDVVFNEGSNATWGSNAPSNVWKPIPKFEGVFNGNGHTISGLYATGTEGMAMFSETTAKAAVSNLYLKNCYFNNTVQSESTGVASISAKGGGSFKNIYSNATLIGNFYGGGIVGVTTAETTIESCWYEGNLSIRQRYAGGIVGITLAETKIEHCLTGGTDGTAVIGSVASTADSGQIEVGGIVGRTSAKTTINDCLNLATVTGMNPGAIVGIAQNVVTVTNAWALDTSCTKLGTNWASDGSNIDWKSTTLANLQGANPDTYTTLDIPTYWSTTAGTPIPKFIDTSWYDETKDTYYLRSKEALYGFMALGQTNNYAGKKIYLTADIVFNEGSPSTWGDVSSLTAWKPIPEFAGELFDGGSHTISGLYVTGATNTAMFGKTTETVTICNLRLENCYFNNTVATESTAVASISGLGGGTFRNVYSNATLIGNYYGGGIIGGTTAKTTIESCWYEGNLSIRQRYAGGIVGITMAETKIEHCLTGGTDGTAVIGSVASTAESGQIEVGGIVGRTNAKTTINDCLNLATVTGINPGAIVGIAQNVVTVTNAWALDTSCTKLGTNWASDGSNIDWKSTTLANLQGANPDTYTTLDIPTYWSTTTGTPIPNAFVK